MVNPKSGLRGRSGGFERRLAAALLIAMAPLAPASGQVRPPSAPRQAAPAASANLPVPDQRTVLKMLWGIMAAVDQANRTGNYSVLRDLGTPAFQANNNPANLAAIFAGLRAQQIDLTDTLVVTPVWEIAPQMVSPTVLRMRGAFPLRPQPIAFDLLFAWDRGWRLDGIAVQAMPAGH
jgi:hypothetical protein